MVSNINQHFILTNDRLIRAALRVALEELCKNTTNIKIIEELGISHGAARVDIAVVNGLIHGYELKSDVDTLARLPNQIEIYNSVLDKVTLVVGKNHLHEAIKIVPDWWGITIASINKANNKVSLFSIREPEQNLNQDSLAIAALLWREEALCILENMGKADGVRSKTRGIIYERLVEVMGKQQLGAAVRECMRTRINWRADPQYTLSGD